MRCGPPQSRAWRGRIAPVTSPGRLPWPFTLAEPWPDPWVCDRAQKRRRVKLHELPRRAGKPWPELTDVLGQKVERTLYDLLFGKPKAPDGTLGLGTGWGRRAADLYAALLAAEPHATAERRHELRIQADKQACQSPLFFDLTTSLSRSISIFNASLGENARLRIGDVYSHNDTPDRARSSCSACL